MQPQACPYRIHEEVPATEHRTSIGLDVHARTVAAAAFVPKTGEVLEKSFGYDPASRATSA